MRGRVCSVFAFGVIAVGIVGASMRPVILAQEAGKPAAKSEKGEGAKKASKSGDRLPPNYTKIGISEEQKKKIYEVQNKYEDQINALEKQIADLKTKQKEDVEGLLTADQKKALQVANDESKKKSAEKKKATEPKTEEAKKGDK